MRKYELTYLVSDLIPESDLNKVTGQVSGYVLDLDGKIIKEDVWGRRKLAYPILKQDFATYVTLYFELEASKIIAFERDLKHADGVVRHLLVVNEIGAEKLTLSMEDIAETKDIEKVVGGEKSFEAVLGETEDSKDLMAKREKSEEQIENNGDTEAEPTEIIEENIETPEVKSAEEIIEEVPAEEPAVEIAKPKAEMKPKKTKKEPVDEAERLNKLNAELDDILKDEL